MQAQAGAAGVAAVVHSTEEAASCDFFPIDELCKLGLNAVDVQKLKQGCAAGALPSPTSPPSTRCECAARVSAHVCLPSAGAYTPWACFSGRRQR